MKKIKNILENKYYLFFSILFFKLIYLVWVLGYDFFKTYHLSDFVGDPYGYLQYAVNFIEHGNYVCDAGKDGVTEYVYRMPGMSFILVPLIYLFSFSNAVKLFIIFQLIISALATTILINLLKERITKNYILYLLIFFLSFGVYINTYIDAVQTETIAQSLMIIIACYFIRVKEPVINKEMIIISLLFVLMFFLRPFMIVFFPLLCLKLTTFSHFKNGFVAFLKSNYTLVLFISVLFLFTSLWTIRNYIRTKEFVPMEYSLRPDKISDLRECETSLIKYILHFGGDQYVTLYNMKSSHHLWFYPKWRMSSDKYEWPNDSIFPKIVFSDGISLDSLKRIRALIDSTLSSPVKSKKRELFFKEYLGAVKRADLAILNNTSFWYHFKLRKESFILFITQPINASRLYANIGFVTKIIVPINKVLNFIFITCVILVFCFLTFFNKENFIKEYFVILPACFLLYFFVGYLNMREERELFCFYPMFLIFGSTSINTVCNRIAKIFTKNTFQE